MLVLQQQMADALVEVRKVSKLVQISLNFAYDLSGWNYHKIH
jgi:hypothetical protein